MIGIRPRHMWQAMKGVSSDAGLGYLADAGFCRLQINTAYILVININSFISSTVVMTSLELISPDFDICPHFMLPPYFRQLVSHTFEVCSASPQASRVIACWYAADDSPCYPSIALSVLSVGVCALLPPSACQRQRIATFTWSAT